MDKTGSLTPNELRNQIFKTKMRGYDPREVSAVLEEVADQWEELVAEGLRLQERNAAFEAQLKKYTDLEQTLRDTLVVARKAAEDETETAKKQAEVMVEQARLKAETIVREANARAEDYRREIIDLQVARSRLQAEMRALLRSFAEQLDRFGGAAKGEAASSPREHSTGTAPTRTFVVPPRREGTPTPDDSAADFDASLSKIFGDDAEVPAVDPLFSDEGAFDGPASKGGKPQERQSGEPAAGADDAEKNW